MTLEIHHFIIALTFPELLVLNKHKISYIPDVLQISIPKALANEPENRKGYYS